MTSHDSSSLTRDDIARFQKAYITVEGLQEAKVFRVDSADGARLIGRNGSGNYAGVIFPNYWPGSATVREYRLRRDKPELEQKPGGAFKEKNKYLSPPGRSNLFYIPPGTPAEYLSDTTVPVVFTEGEKKALALYRYFAERGERVLVIALPGVWNWRGTVGKTTDEQGARRDVKGVIPDFGRVSWQDRTAYIVFDSNVRTDESVRAARRELSKELVRRSAAALLVDLPEIEGVNGIDDLLALRGPEFVRGLFEGAIDSGVAAPPKVELLEDEPLVMRRPLVLLDGHAYAATWPHVRVTTTQSTDRKGNTVTHNPPLVHNERKLLVIRDDGEALADFGDYSRLAEAEFTVSLPEIPPGEKLWSVRGVKSFLRGDRPEPAEVFGKIVDVVDRFIDFDRSLADQRTTAEMVGCYVMSTWFLDAFTVVGFLWPNGEKGSGKTQLLTIVAELSYLGQVILAGGSFAALRDLADYGAFLAFDDAENLSDPKKTDPDKRTLLLAGNRRGNTVPLKEPLPGGGWRTRHVSTFCPRAFSAIRLPDQVLASRTIVVPLIRTPDRYRANAEVLDYRLWPHDRRGLTDSLWALALTNLPKLSEYESRVNASASLTGRALEPWRALLAVALWLDEAGVSGLWEHMEKLSTLYQVERQELESGDFTVLIVRALCRLAGCDVSDISDVSDIRRAGGAWLKKTAQITETAKQIAEQLELDIDLEQVNGRRVGRAMGKMRFNQPTEGGGRGREWRFTASELERWVLSLGLLKLNVTNVTNGAAEPEYEEVLL